MSRSSFGEQQSLTDREAARLGVDSRTYQPQKPPTVLLVYPKEGTQKHKALKALRDADGQWVSGQVFLRELYLSQFHARIFELQADGWDIEASEATDGHGF